MNNQLFAGQASEMDAIQKEELLELLRSGQDDMENTEHDLQDIPDEELSHSYMEHAAAIVKKGIAKILAALWEQQPLLLMGDSLSIMNYSFLPTRNVVP